MRKSVFNWAKSERGNVAILFGLMLPLVVGGAAYGVETTYWYLTRLQLQNAADAAAMAGAMDKRSGYTTDTITASATKAATDNGFVNATPNTITVNTPPTTGSSGNQAVEVILTSRAQRFFTGVFTKTNVNVRARAVAKYQSAGNACVLALSSSAGNAANFQGSTNVTLTACSVMSNSLSNSAVAVQGAATLTTECTIAVGGIYSNGGITQTCGSSITGAAPVADPFGGQSIPTSCTGTQWLNSNANPLQPGCYPNGIKLSPNQTVTFQPGTYILMGDFDINNNVTATGSGVTFIFMGSSKATFNGGATIQLTAPATGTYQGMLFMGDRNNTSEQKFLGNASSQMTGNFYFKKGKVTHQGNFNGINGCTQVVADTVDWTGNSNFGVDCSTYGMTPIPAIYTVRLSE